MERQSTLDEVRRRFAGVQRTSAPIYWVDLLISTGVAWGAFVLAARTVFFSWPWVVLSLVSVLAFLRAVLFIHELAHLKLGAVPGFDAAWNLLIGFPFLVPSLMYWPHVDHHRPAVFGTDADPEYARLAQFSRWSIVGFVFQVLPAPILLVLRWGVLGPLSAPFPSVRRLLVQRASTLGINPCYLRSRPVGRRAVTWRRQELAMVIVVWAVAGAWYAGWIPGRWLLQWFVTGAGVFLINQVRTLAAHRYDGDGHRQTAGEQLLDSVTLDGWPVLTALAAPLGLRYHALHHFVPTVPYHSLAELHRTFLRELSADSPYRRTRERGILATVLVLLRHARPRVGVPALSEGRAAGKVSE